MSKAPKIIHAPTTQALKPGTGSGVALAREVTTIAISAQVILPIKMLVRGSMSSIQFVCYVNE
ncbi:hypothetical protein D3C81_2029270 [compost metagenome]